MKTAAHFLLLLLAVTGADDSDIISNNEVVDEQNVMPKRKLVRRPDSERQLEPRKLSVTMEKIHTRSYTVVTAPKDITFVLPPNVQKKVTLQGSYFTTFGGVFRSSSVELVPTKQVNFFPGNAGPGANDIIETNVLQPASNPEIDEDFTLAGKCTVTNGISITTILSHSCFYDLCVGKPTDCVNIYAGTKFEFRPLQQSNANGIATNIQNNGLLDPKGKFNDDWSRKLQNQPGAPVQDSNFLEPDSVTGFDITNGRSALPPSFPGFCIGGIGRFAGIDCNFELITVAQRTINPTTIETVAPTGAPVEPPSNRRDLSVEDEDQEDEDRELQRNGDADDGRAKGVIVQKIFITSNIRLPLGPKAI